jgi:hypothetical protein
VSTKTVNWWEQYDEVADELDGCARERAYVVTFWEHPDQTGFQSHVYTWAADSPEQAVEFAWQQVNRIEPRPALHSADARAVGVTDRALLHRAADDIRTLTDGLKRADPNQKAINIGALDSLRGGPE